MQFTPREKRQSFLSGKRNPTLYPHSLQFYRIPPTNVISLEEFEDLALERLKVLRLIERAGAKFSKNSKDYREMIISDLKKMKLKHYYKVTVKDEKIKDETFDGRRRDHISHFILRLAYCRRDDLRRWFINQEVDLFRFRFVSEQTESRKSFMQLNELNYDEISDELRNNTADNLCVGYTNTKPKVMSTKFYRVPFVEVLDLVKSRRVYLNQGYAFITEEDLVITVLSAFRTHLSHALADSFVFGETNQVSFWKAWETWVAGTGVRATQVTSRALPQLQEDTRLINMLATLHQRYIGTDYTKRRTDFTGEVSIEQIDALSKTSFPLCMRNLHEVLRKQHHLKYNGRLQYGLFLKGIGLTLEDALRFWRDEFTKVMDVDKFDKQYSYNIRYNYGKEGKRANFSPYSCMKIIMSNTPGPGEFHGCPFKHSDESNLKQMLQSLHISSGGINNIVDLATKGHYQIACTRYFELTHNEATPDQGINHPNHFFEESRKVLLGTKKEEKSSNVTQVSSSASKPSQKTTTQPNSTLQPSVTNDSQVEMEFENDNIEEILSGLKGV